MSIDRKTNLASLNAFGEVISINGHELVAEVEEVEILDENRAIYYDAIEISFPVESLDIEVDRGATVLWDERTWSIIKRPSVSGGWAECKARLNAN